MIGRSQTRVDMKKIRPLDDLVATIGELRAEGRTIVHCHGVFDLLHIGHIRHFDEARGLGDVLVVTVTPDRYVNKGPHRPAFPEHLRAEAIAALAGVDYVAINKWPTAVETIQLLQPHFYVKGPDYRDRTADRTGGITLEEGAVRAVGGALVVTDGIAFSATHLINRHLPALPKEANEFLGSFRRRYRPDEVLGYLDNAGSLSALAIGEAIVDEYQYCEAIGKSGKEPILAVKRLSTESFAGGILAVGNHLANFAGRVGLISVLGDVDSREEFVRGSLHPAITSRFLYRAGAPTIVKRRFIESYFFSKMLEVYEIEDSLPSAADQAALCAALREEASRYDVAVVVDFGHGMFGHEVIETVAAQAKFLAINAQSNAANVGYQTISRFPRAEFICMTEAEIRMEARDRRGNLRPMILHMAEKMRCPRLVVTRGKYGCVCYGKDEGFFDVPALAGQIVDRMGAGDAFLAITSLCAAQGAPMEVIGFIGNAVGAQAVATVGHRHSIERVPLVRHIESLLK